MKSIGFIQAVSAYLIWGMFPLYWRWLETVPPVEIIGHRIFWSFVTLFIFILLRKKLGIVITAIKDTKVLLLLVITSLLITLNWLVYIWAIISSRVVESSLGYYMCPLVSVLLGVLFLKERLRRLQYVAIFCAFLGVLLLVITTGSLPWASLGVAITFSFYSLFRKWTPVDAQSAMLIETGLLFIPATLYLVFAEHSNAIVTGSLSIQLLLICGGAVTLVPLILMTSSLKTLPLSTAGFLQYISPTLQFILGVWLFKENFDSYKLISFSFIWLGLIIYSLESVAVTRKQKKLARAATVTE